MLGTHLLCDLNSNRTCRKTLHQEMIKDAYDTYINRLLWETSHSNLYDIAYPGSPGQVFENHEFMIHMEGFPYNLLKAALNLELTHLAEIVCAEDGQLVENLSHCLHKADGNFLIVVRNKYRSLYG